MINQRPSTLRKWQLPGVADVIKGGIDRDRVITPQNSKMALLQFKIAKVSLHRSNIKKKIIQ